MPWELIANIRGPQGPRGFAGARGAQGLPGVNALENDAAVAAYISTTGQSETQDAADYRYSAPTTAFQDLIGKLLLGHQSPSLLICSDSTARMLNNTNGDDAPSWVYQAAPMIAERFGIQVRLRVAIAGTPPSWSASTVYGTGSKSLTIWNASFDSQSWEYNMEINRREPLIVGTNPDAVIFSYGHNENFAQAQVNNMQPQRDKMIACVESIRSFIPSVSVVIMSQNPLLAADKDMASQYRADMYRRYATDRGYGFIDICAAFINSGRVLTDIVYSDGIHPNAAGHKLWADEFMRHFHGRPGSQGIPAQPPAFSQGARNWLPNSTFRMTAGALPGWTLSNLALANGTSVHEVENTSLAINNVAAALGAMNFDLPVNLFRGQYVTFAVRMYIPNGSSSGAGRVGLISSEDTYLSDLWSGTRGQWFWRTVSGRVKPFATTLRVQIAVTTAAEATTIYIDRASVVVGAYPADA